MRLASLENDILLELEENTVNVLCIENPRVFSGVIEDFINQTNGKEGQFILSAEDKQLNFEKSCDFIISPFYVDINNKKVVNRLYAELSDIAKEEMYLETLDMNARITAYLQKLMNLSSYEVDFSEELNISGLLKLFDVKIAVEDLSVLEKLTEYIKAMHRICRIELFILLNIKQYIEDDELSEFYKFCFYEKVHIIVLEGQYSQRKYFENVFILDKDLCIIRP